MKQLAYKIAFLKSAQPCTFMSKEGGFWEWTGENVVGPMSKGVSKFYSKGSGGTDYEDLGENVVAPLLKGVDKKLDIAKGIRNTVAETIPVATAAAGNQMKDWLKAKGQGWEQMFGGALEKLKGSSPEALQPILSKIQQHPYLTPTLAAILPLLLYKLKKGHDARSRNKRVDAALSARPLNRFL